MVRNKLTPQNDRLLSEKFLVLDKQEATKNVINLYAALVRKEDFLSKHSPLNKTSYITGLSNIIQDLKFERRQLCELYNQYFGLKASLRTFNQRFRKWVEKDLIPLPIIRLLSRTISIKDGTDEKTILVKFLLNASYMTDRIGQSRLKIILKLEDLLSPERLYDVGIAIADGTLLPYQQLVYDGSPNGFELNLCKEFLEKLKILKVKIWGINPNSITIRKGKNENKNMWRLEIHNKFYSRFLNFIYDLPIGKKYEKLQEPSIMQFLPKVKQVFLKKFFYRGIIDGDGSVDLLVNLWTKSQRLKEQFIDFLFSIGIQGKSRKDRQGFDIFIPAVQFDKYATQIASSHPRLLKKVLKRLKIEPKSYKLKCLKKHMLTKDGYFDLAKLNLRIDNSGKYIEKYCQNSKLSKDDLSEILDVKPCTIEGWIKNRARIPLQKFEKLISLTNKNLYEELEKNNLTIFMYANHSCLIKLPLKPSSYLLGLLKFTIPQVDGDKVLIKKEDTDLEEFEFDNLLKAITNYFKCKVIKNPSSGAYFIYSKALTQFIITFFEYEKPWYPYDENTLEKLKSEWQDIWKGGDN